MQNSPTHASFIISLVWNGDDNDDSLIMMIIVISNRDDDDDDNDNSDDDDDYINHWKGVDIIISSTFKQWLTD